MEPFKSLEWDEDFNVTKEKIHKDLKSFISKKYIIACKNVDDTFHLTKASLPFASRLLPGIHKTHVLWQKCSLNTL